MEPTNAAPSARRRGPSRRLVAAWAAGAGALALLVGGLAAAAQHLAVVTDGEYADETHSLAGHVATMVLLGCLAVAVARALVRTGSPLLAGGVLAATAVGPMTVVAVPVRASMVAPTGMDTRLWWHAVVATAVLTVLAGWLGAVLLAGRRAGRPVRDPASRSAGRGRGPSDDAVAAVVGVVGFAACWNHSWQLQESPGVAPSLGWAVLAAGTAVAAARGRRWSALALFVGAGVVLGTMAASYLRPGGRPGVAGWEFRGMQSPVVLSAGVAAVVLAGPFVGLAVRAARHWAHRRSVTPGTGSAPAAVATG